jgi:hypothetical protein
MRCHTSKSPKHALTRFMEFIPMGRSPLASSSALRFWLRTMMQSPNVRAFPIHPGSIPTDVARSSGFLPVAELFPDKLKLASAFILHLAAEKADWLSLRGRYVPSYSSC